jgi:adenine-specific DNA-methyltransferase
MRLNRQDGGGASASASPTTKLARMSRRRCARGPSRRPEWEALGICDYITKPRVQAAITGKTPDGAADQGRLQVHRRVPDGRGLRGERRVLHPHLRTPLAVSYQTAFARIAPLLWMRAGSARPPHRRLPERAGTSPMLTGLLVDLDCATDFLKATRKAKGLRVAYIVTDDERLFQALARRLPEGVEPVRLYESYLTNFELCEWDERMKFTLKDYQDEAVRDVLVNLKRARAGARTATSERSPSR